MPDDDERIERLTELARRVPAWKGADLVVGADEVSAWVLDHRPHANLDLLLIKTPNALDALEAALLVMAGEHDIEQHYRERINRLSTRCAELDAALSATSADLARAQKGLPPAWVEKLAAEWEQRSINCGNYSFGRYTTLDECAAELRARAKGGERG